MATRFHQHFIGKPIISSFYTDITLFYDIIICKNSIRDIFVQSEEALSIEENVYQNLFWVFYSNMELSTIWQNKIITFVSEVRIEFDKANLSRILRILYEGLDIYTTRKELEFNDFRHVDGVKNICRRRDLSVDLCTLSFRSQLLLF